MLNRLIPKVPALLTVLSLVLPCGAARADELHLAVAANFAEPMQRIANEFEKESGNKVSIISGATGKFYIQIKNGAPFDMLFAADAAIPAKLENEGEAVAGSRFTYAIGKLVLWSATPGFVDENGEVLRKGAFEHLSIANPAVAPYGAAAAEVLKARNLSGLLQVKLVEGENIAQAFQFVSTGNAALGFVAMSQVFEDGKLKSGSAWIVPGNLYSPIRQDALVLLPGKGKPAVRAFVEFMKGEQAARVIHSYGYDMGR